MRSKGYGKTRELFTCTLEIDEPFYYDLPKVFKVLKSPPKRIDDVLENLKGNGYKASRTHLADTGIKTDAPYDIVLNSIR